MEGAEGVALVVPTGFDAYARVLHPLRDGRTWHEVAPSFVHRSPERYEYPYPEPLSAVEGDLGPDALAALLEPLRAATSTSEQCAFGLWAGWGGLHPGTSMTLFATTGGWLARRRSVRAARRAHDDRQQAVHRFVERCAVRSWWGGRDMLLFHGPLDAVVSLGRSPQWWWPEDRAWFVGTEIDFPWTYVAGSAALVDSLLERPGLEVVAVDASDPW